MNILYLVISLSKKVVVGVFQLKQEAEAYVDTFEKNVFGNNYVVIKAQIDSTGKICPESDTTNDPYVDKEPSWLDDYLGIKDELEELK